MTGQQIAQTTLQQIGGSRFIAMTGARLMTYDEKGALNFRIGKNPSKITHVKIELNDHDLYDMMFVRIWKTEPVHVEKVEGVCFDQLQDIFTEKTGMDTHL